MSCREMKTDPKTCANYSKVYESRIGTFCILKRQWIEVLDGCQHITGVSGSTGICDNCKKYISLPDLSVQDRCERICRIDFLIRNYREELFRLYYEGVTSAEHNEIWFGVHSDGLPHLEM